MGRYRPYGKREVLVLAGLVSFDGVVSSYFLLDARLHWLKSTRCASLLLIHVCFRGHFVTSTNSTHWQFPNISDSRIQITCFCFPWFLAVFLIVCLLFLTGGGVFCRCFARILSLPKLERHRHTGSGSVDAMAEVSGRRQERPSTPPIIMGI